MNEIRLEELAETIFEHMMESFKDLTPSEEQLVYECACDQAVSQTSWQSGTLTPPQGGFFMYY